MAYVAILALLAVISMLTAAEMATFSARKERMVQATEAGDRRGTLVIAYQRSPASFLSAAQWLATAATITLGSVNSEWLQPPVELWLQRQGLTEDAAETTAFLAILTFITLISLIFTNVAPKQWAFVRANEIALKSSRPMRWIIRLLAPLSFIVTIATKAILKLFHVTPDEKMRVTEQDISSLIIEGERAGAIHRDEGQIVRRALALSDISVDEIMTPRDQIVWVDEYWPAKKMDEVIRTSGRSLLPVCRGSLDNCVGILRARDWLVEVNPQNDDAKRLSATPVFVDRSASILEVMEALRPADTRCILIRDEKHVIGLVTLNSVIQRIVGPISDVA